MDGVLRALLLVIAGTAWVSANLVCQIGTVYYGHEHELRWLLPYEDPCRCSMVRLGGASPDYAVDQRASHYLDYLLLSEDLGKIKDIFDCPDCVEPLGMESGDIPDWSLHVSYDKNVSHLRLGSGAALCGSLIPNVESPYSWVKVVFEDFTTVTGIITMGDQHRHAWVETYNIQYNHERTLWPYLYMPGENGNVIKEFHADNPGEHTVYFHQEVRTTAIKIVLVAWHNEPCFHFELLGCKGCSQVHHKSITSPEPIKTYVRGKSRTSPSRVQ